MRNEPKILISKATEQAADDEAPEVEGHAARMGRMVEPPDDGDGATAKDAEVEGHGRRYQGPETSPATAKPDDDAETEEEVEGHGRRW